MDTVLLKSPCCNRKLKGAELLTTATVVVKRTCNKCGSKWNVTVKPMSHKDGVHVHELAWHCTQGKD